MWFHTLATLKVQVWISREDADEWWSWNVFPKAAIGN